jgi:hypothetical protein
MWVEALYQTYVEMESTCPEYLTRYLRIGATSQVQY